MFLLVVPHYGMAQAAVRDMSTVDAALDRYMAQPPAMSDAVDFQGQDSLPRWKSSLGDIQDTSASLLSENARLSGEYTQLKMNQEDLQARLRGERVKNEASARQAGLEGLEQDGAGEVARLKKEIPARDREVQAQQDALAVLKSRLTAAKKRATLARLRVAELQVAKKSRVIDAQTRGQAALNDLRAEVEGARQRIALTREQTRVLLEKTAELEKIDRPYLPRIREVVAANVQIKERLVGLRAEKESAESKWRDLEALRGRSAGDQNARRIAKLLADRASLETRLKDADALLADLKAHEPEDAQGLPPSPEAAARQLEQQNKSIEEETGELRENVALLEYKVNTLQRYKDRNKPASRPK